LIKLSYLYYKNDSTYTKIKKRIEAKGGEAAESLLRNVYMCENSHEQVKKIVDLVQTNGQPKMRVKATLLQVYHLALHNKVT